MARRSTLSAFYWVGLLNIALAAAATAVGEPVDARLKTAYRELRFAEMYPPEAVQMIQTRLQDAPRAVTVLAELAKDQQPAVRILVATLLGHLGEAVGAETLWVLLLDPVESVRVTAAGALLRLRRFTPIVSSFDGLKHESPAIRGLTAATLGSLSDKNAEPALVEALGDPEERVRLEAARALGSCGTKASVPPMLKQLSQDKSVLTRTALVRTLGGHQGPEVTDALSKALQEDPDWHVRAAAALGLGGLCANPAEAKRMTAMMAGRMQSDDFALVRDRAVDAMGCARDEEALLALLQAILSDSCDSRVHAVQSVCLNKIAGIVPHLMPHIYHPNAEVREKIFVIFGELGGSQQLPAVAEAAADPDPSVRLAAVNALRQMGQRGGALILLAKLSDPNPHIRAAAVKVLGGMGDRSVSLKLLPLLQDDSGFVRPPPRKRWATLATGRLCCP
jgi:HEAT repeat protein